MKVIRAWGISVKSAELRELRRKRFRKSKIKNIIKVTWNFLKWKLLLNLIKTNLEKFRESLLQSFYKRFDEKFSKMCFGSWFIFWDRSTIRSTSPFIQVVLTKLKIEVVAISVKRIFNRLKNHSTSKHSAEGVISHQFHLKCWSFERQDAILIV